MPRTFFVNPIIIQHTNHKTDDHRLSTFIQKGTSRLADAMTKRIDVTNSNQYFLGHKSIPWWCLCGKKSLHWPKGLQTVIWHDVPYKTFVCSKGKWWKYDWTPCSLILWHILSLYIAYMLAWHIYSGSLTRDISDILPAFEHSELSPEVTHQGSKDK